MCMPSSGLLRCLDPAPVREKKRQASYCHKSQSPDGFWVAHEAMHRRRGAECGVDFAEAYCLVEPKKGRPLLPVEFLHKVGSPTK